MTKTYPVQSSISNAKLQQLLKGKKVQVSGGEIPVKFIFKKLKDFNRHVKNLSAGKSHRIHKDDLEDIEDSEGGSLFGKIGHAFKHFGHKIEHVAKKSVPVLKKIGKVAAPIAKSVAKTAIPLASQSLGTAVGAYTGNPLMGQMAGQMSGDLATNAIGNGFFDTIKKQGMKLAKEQGKKLAQKAVKVGAQKLQEHISEHISGQGLFGDALKLGKSVAKQQAKKLAQKAVQKGAEMISNKIASVGGSVDDSYGLGGNRLLNNPAQPMSVKERMAYVRSHRGKKGGSFIQ